MARPDPWLEHYGASRGGPPRARRLIAVALAALALTVVVAVARRDHSWHPPKGVAFHACTHGNRVDARCAQLRVPADAMGYRPFKRFYAVELPLALPGIVAGLRLATVSTVSLISVGAIIGRGGLGRMFSDGYVRRINIEIWSALVATMVLALVFDLIIYSAGRAATPWSRRTRAVAA